MISASLGRSEFQGASDASLGFGQRRRIFVGSIIIIVEKDQSVFADSGTRSVFHRLDNSCNGQGRISGDAVLRSSDGERNAQFLSNADVHSNVKSKRSYTFDGVTTLMRES